jgi:hypothetical protein
MGLSIASHYASLSTHFSFQVAAETVAAAAVRAALVQAPAQAVAE